MATTDLWTYAAVVDTDLAATDLTGFSVEALDGKIGKVDEATNDVTGSYIVVDTGPWIFGKKVMLPAGIIDSVDTSEGVVHVNRTKDQIKNSPEFDKDKYTAEPYRTSLTGYYGPGGSGYRDESDETM